MRDEGPVEEATRLIRVGRPDDAREVLSAHLASAPTDSSALLVLTLALITSGREEEALESATAAASLAPDNIDAVLAVASLSLSLQCLSEALDAARAAQDIDPASFSAHSIEAMALARMGATEESVKAAQEAIDLVGQSDEERIEGLRMFSSVLFDVPGRGVESTAYLREAVAIDPTDDELRGSLAAAQVCHGEPWVAVRTATTVLSTSPTSPLARGVLLIALVRVQRRALLAQFVIAMLTAVIGLGFIGDALDIETNPELIARISGVLGTALNLLLLLWITRRIPPARPLLTATRRTLAAFPGAATAWVLQGIAMAMPLLAIVTGWFLLIAPVFAVVILAHLCVRFSASRMLDTAGPLLDAAR